MKKTVLSAIFFAAFTGLSFGQVNTDELPQNARDFINENFSSETIDDVEKNDGIKKYFHSEMYEVEFINGIKIDFDKQGEVTEIESEDGNAIPHNVLPGKIGSYIQTNYRDAQIVGWEKEDKEQEVKLADGTELEFDDSGEFLQED